MNQSEPIKIIDLQVDWMDGWGNSPRWEALLSRDPDFSGPVWELKPQAEGKTTCRAEDGICVDYFHHNPRDQAGYGGSIFNITDKSGKEHSFKGPWSSRSGVINREFPKHDMCVETAYTSDPKRWSEGHASTSGDLKVQAIVEWLQANNFVCRQLIVPHGMFQKLTYPKPDIIRGVIGAALIEDSGEIYLQPLREDGSVKGNRGKIIKSWRKDIFPMPNLKG